MAKFSEDAEKSMIFENYDAEYERFTLILILKKHDFDEKGDYMELEYTYEKTSMF